VACYPAFAAARPLSSSVSQHVIRAFFRSGLAFLFGYLVSGVVESAIDVYLAGHFDRIFGQAFTFELSLLVVLVCATTDAFLFAVFLALLRTPLPVLLSSFLGAFGWLLIIVVGYILGSVPFPSTNAFLLLIGTPLVASGLGRVISRRSALQRAIAG